MQTTELRDALGRLDFARDLPDEAVDRLAECCEFHQVEAGAVVFREGSDHDRLYLIDSGHVALEMAIPGRGSIRILTLGGGEMMGWSALLGSGPMTASAIAVESSRLIVADAVTLGELCDDNPEFGYSLMQRVVSALSKRLVATRLQLLDMFSTAPPAIPAKSLGTGAAEA